MAKAKKKSAKKKPRRNCATYSERVDLTLTPEMVKKVCAIVARGNFRYVAFQEVGVQRSTWAAWVTKGRKELREFAEGKRDKLTIKATLVVELDRAEAKAHTRILKDVVESDDPRLKMDFLKARYNKLYSRNPNAHVDDEDGTETQVDALELLADKLRSLMGEE